MGRPRWVRRAPSFQFRTLAGTSDGVGFECSLAAAAANGTDSYAPCSSPATYGNLTDGHYAFRVRAAGEQVADSRSFIQVAAGSTCPPIPSPFVGCMSALAHAPAPSNLLSIRRQASQLVVLFCQSRFARSPERGSEGTFTWTSAPSQR